MEKYKINTILVALDLSKNDDALIDRVIRLSHISEIYKVYFLNIQKNLDLDDKIEEKHPDVVAPLDEQIKKMIEEKIKSSSAGAMNSDYDIFVDDGDPTKKILKWTKIKDVDLLLLGKKITSEGSGVSANKIARTCSCSVSFIPEVVQENPNEVIVPIDFSEPSILAVRQALFLFKEYPTIKVNCVHFYEVPSGYHTSGKSYEEFAQVMKENSTKEFNRIKEIIGEEAKNLTCNYVLNENNSIAEQILKYAVKEKASGIIVGSRGRTMAASLVLGSVADKLISINTHFSLFIAKEKNKNLSFLEALIDT